MDVRKTAMHLRKKRKSKRLVRLRCAVQNYQWGITGKESQVSRLFALNSASDVDFEKPYAELWIGTHESGPSFLDYGESGFSGDCLMSLKSWIAENPNVLGDRVLKTWNGDLPFLFKVLSIEKALSIQAHPDKELARSLHKLQPSVYKDDNHKPEMTLALTDFEALCGFISPKELKGVLHTVPEIAELVGCGDAEQILNFNELIGNEKLNAGMEFIFTQLMSSSEGTISKMTSKLKRRLNLEAKERQLTEKEQLVLKLETQYPGDVGVLAAFLLNHVKLNRGEALYLGQNEPHAYIHGECIECMGNSDNVVRAGLTSKQRDVPTLTSMLTYKQGYPEIMRGIPLNPYTRRYLPPLDEFEVDHCVLPQAATVVFPSVPGPSILLCINGRGTIDARPSDRIEVEEGGILFVPAYKEITITAESVELQMYRSGVNSRFLGTKVKGLTTEKQLYV